MTAASLSGHHETGGLKQLRLQPLNLLEVTQQAIPARRRIAELKGFEGGLTEPAPLPQIVQGCGPLR